jgi:hypothetical protein
MLTMSSRRPSSPATTLYKYATESESEKTDMPVDAEEQEAGASGLRRTQVSNLSILLR